MSSDFARLVSLACHDLRTPLATVQGFAKTLLRMDVEPAQRERYLGMIDAASVELAELTDRLALVARIEGGRYEPVLREVDSLELARAADPDAAGDGSMVRVEPDSIERALRDLLHAVSRHGDVEPHLHVDGSRLALRPVPGDAAAIALGEDARDLGAAVAVTLVRAIGGEASVDGETMWVSLPA